jgi:hypothetical protein
VRIDLAAGHGRLGGRAKKLAAGLRLLLWHPGVAAIRCRDCERYVYDLETGKLKTYRSGPSREEKPQLRPAGTLPPCGDCPKGGKHREWETRLSAANLKTLALYRETRAGVPLSRAERRDSIVRENMALIDGLVRDWERHRQGEEFAMQVATLLYRR